MTGGGGKVGEPSLNRCLKNSWRKKLMKLATRTRVLRRIAWPLNVSSRKPKIILPPQKRFTHEAEEEKVIVGLPGAFCL